MPELGSALGSDQSNRHESRPCSVCVFDPDAQRAAIYSSVFGSSSVRLLVFSVLSRAAECLRSSQFDLVVGALDLSNQSLLDFIDCARRYQSKAGLLIVHPDYEPKDAALLKKCGVQVCVPSSTTVLAYRRSIGLSLKALSGRAVSGVWLNECLNLDDSSLNSMLILTVSDLVDRKGHLVRLPSATHEFLSRDLELLSRTLDSVETGHDVSLLSSVVETIGKPRTVLGLLSLVKEMRDMDRASLCARLLSLMPCYPSKLALEHIAKGHSTAGVRIMADREAKAQLRRYPIIFYVERLLSDKTSTTAKVEAAESIGKCDGVLAAGILSRVLMVKSQAVQQASIRGLGRLGSEAALEEICRRVRMFRLVQDTAYFKDKNGPEKYMLYLEALATVLRSINKAHPEVADDVACDLDSEDLGVKLKAIEIVGLSKTPSCCAKLVRLMSSEQWRVRMAVLEAIVGSNAPDAARFVRGFAADTNHLISDRAVKALEKLDLREELREALRHEHVGVKTSAAAALGRLTDETSVKELCLLTSDKEHAVAHEALMSLSKISDDSCVPSVERLLESLDNPDIVADAAYCLGKICTDASLRALLRQVRHLVSLPDFRLPLLIRAIGAIVNSGKWQHNESMLVAVLDLLEHAGAHPDDAVRLEIAGLLLSVRGLKPKTYDRMLALLENFVASGSDMSLQRSRMRSIALEAIERLGKMQRKALEIESVHANIRKILVSLPLRPEGERHRMLAALGELLCALPQSARSQTGSISDEAVDVLLRSLDDETLPWSDRASALKSLSLLGERRALPALRNLEKADSVGERLMAKQAIRSIVKKNLYTPREQVLSGAHAGKQQNLTSSQAIPA